MVKRKLKNYSTSVPAMESINQIQAILLSFGAKDIMMTADNNRKSVIGISFTMDVLGKTVPFRIPVNVEKVQEYLYLEYMRSTSRPRKGKEDFYSEAERVAWRINKDWIHSQISILETEQVPPFALLMGLVMLDKDTTFFQAIEQGKFRNLLPSFEGTR